MEAIGYGVGQEKAPDIHRDEREGQDVQGQRGAVLERVHHRLDEVVVDLDLVQDGREE